MDDPRFGIFGFLIMLVSFAMVAIIMMIALQLRQDNYLPTAFIEEFEQRLQSKDYQGLTKRRSPVIPLSGGSWLRDGASDPWL